ncbi:hypothetical protein Tco_0602194 [Tanacetum coccineum]
MSIFDSKYDIIFHNIYRNPPSHQGRRGNFAVGDLTDADYDDRVDTSRDIETGTKLSREVFENAVIRVIRSGSERGMETQLSYTFLNGVRTCPDNDNWPINDGVFGGGGPRGGRPEGRRVLGYGSWLARLNNLKGCFSADPYEVSFFLSVLPSDRYAVVPGENAQAGNDGNDASIPEKDVKRMRL